MNIILTILGVFGVIMTFSWISIWHANYWFMTQLQKKGYSQTKAKSILKEELDIWNSIPTGPRPVVKTYFREALNHY